jgi:putative ABC transport system substrate-binding protein
VKRREFLGIGVVAAAWPRGTFAQQRAPQHRIAMFHPAIPTRLLTETGGGSAWRAFFGELRRLGYVEGENLIIERYSADENHDRYAPIARQIVSSSRYLIVTGTNPVVTAFKGTASTIPFVVLMLDPLKAGLVTDLARPGGNLTGITLDAGVEIWGKRLELLSEAVPSMARVAFLGMRGGWGGSSEQVLRDAAERLGVALSLMLPPEGTSSEIERVFAAMAEQRPDAVLVSGPCRRGAWAPAPSLSEAATAPLAHCGRWDSGTLRGRWWYVVHKPRGLPQVELTSRTTLRYSTNH